MPLLGLLLGLLLAAAPSPAAVVPSSPWRIQSPAPAAVVPVGEVFVLAAPAPGVVLDPATVVMRLDDVDVTDQAQIGGDRIALLYTRPLAAGRHEIQITARADDGAALPPLYWTFEIAAPPVSERAVLTGTATVDARGTDLSGPGTVFRRDPLQRQALNLDVAGTYRGVRVPVRVQLSSDQATALLPQNQIMVGVETGPLALYAGDHAPSLNPILVDGVRTRGVHGRLRLGLLHVDVLHGALRRGIEGVLLSRLTGAIDPGTYRRMLSGVRLGVGRERGLLVSVNAFRGRDATGSIDFGRSPQENLTVGTDLSLRLGEDRFRFTAGGAAAITTEDIGRGPITPEAADTLAGITLPFDPADYRWLITLNASTVPLAPSQLPDALAWYAESELRLGSHVLGARYRNVGASFRSFGNPYLQTNRYSAEVTDRFAVLGRRVSGLVQLRQYGTPPGSTQQPADLLGRVGSVNVTLAVHPSWPRLLLGIRLHDRERTYREDGTQQTSTLLTALTAGGLYGFQTGPLGHQLSVFYTRSVRDDRLRPTFGTTTQTVSAGLTERFAFPLTLGVQVTRLDVSSEALGALQALTSITGTAAYRLFADDLRLSTSLRNTHASATSFSGSSDRRTLSVGATYRVLQNFDVELQVGYGTYREDGVPARDYDERYVVLRQRYTF